MSSHGASSEQASAEDSTVWHPAQEWLDDDDLDMDYQPQRDLSEDDDEWEDDVHDEDEDMGLGLSDGRTNNMLRCSAVPNWG